MKIPRIPITDELRADIERQMAELRLTWDKLAALVPASKPGLWQAFSLAAQRSTAKKGRDNSRYTIRVCQILNLNPVRYLLPPDERRLLRALDKARLHDQAETFIGEAEQRVAWLTGRPEKPTIALITDETPPTRPR